MYVTTHNGACSDPSATAERKPHVLTPRTVTPLHNTMTPLGAATLSKNAAALLPRDTSASADGYNGLDGDSDDDDPEQPQRRPAPVAVIDGWARRRSADARMLRARARILTRVARACSACPQERLLESSLETAAAIEAQLGQQKSQNEHLLAELAEQVDAAFGEDGARLGMEVRATGGIPLLAWLLADPDDGVQQTSLMILGNLCSDSVDAESRATKQLLLQSGGARAILSCVHTEDPAVLLFACGALQNLCYEYEWSELAVSHDVHKRLEALAVSHEDAMVVRYASGALQNITRVLQLPDGLSDLAVEAIKERSLEHRREEWQQQRASARIAKALNDIPSDVRQRRHVAGTRRRQRAAQLDASSRPSSAASSRSTSSFVSARSSATASSAASGGPQVVAPLASMPASPLLTHY